MRKERYLHSLLVLYAEDSDIFREKIGNMLSLLVGKLVFAKDGEEAYLLYKELEPDIIFLDNQMPKMSGRQMAERIRADGDTVPIVFISSIDNTNELIECVSLSLTDYILKPVSFDKLEIALDRCIKMFGSYINSQTQERICDGIVYDSGAKGVLVGDFFVSLTKYEHRLIELLISKNGAICTSDEIALVVYDGNMSVAALRNTIKRIRDKTGVDFVESVKNIGYKLRC